MPSSAFLFADLAEVAALWKLALVATVAFLGWLYRGALRTLIQTGSLRLRRGQTELEMRPASQPAPSFASEPEEEPPPDRPDGPGGSTEDVRGQERPDSSEGGDPDEAGEVDQPTVGALIRALSLGDEQGANDIFEGLQAAEEDEGERLRNSVFYAYGRAFWTGDSEAVRQLEEFTQVESVSSFAYRLNGLVHERANNYDQAVASFESAVSSATDSESRLRAIKDLARTVFSAGQEDKALALLTAELPALTPRERVVIYDALADLYSRRDDFLARALALEKTLDIYPTSARRRFEVGYAYSRAEREDLALIHYKVAVEIDPNHEAALNNLGVAYERLGMPIKAVANYKSGFEHGNTLAAANLSTRYLNGGFADEARGLLTEAATRDNPHENVAQKMTELNEAVERQNSRREEVEAKAERRRQFLRKFAEALFMPSDPPILNGDWVLDGSIDVVITQAEASFNAAYEVDGIGRQLRGSLVNRALELERFTERPIDTSPLTSNVKSDGNGRGIVTGDSVELFFEEDAAADHLHELRRRQANAPSDGRDPPRLVGDSQSEAVEPRGESNA